MNSFRNSATFILLATFCLVAQITLAQGSNVKVVADFTKPVNVGHDQVLQPGRYTFNLVQDQTDRDVFRVQSDDGKNVTLTGTNFDARKSGISNISTAASSTHILLENVDGQLYLHRISLGGQDRGFQFQLPDNIKDRVNQSTQVVIPASGGNAQ